MIEQLLPILAAPGQPETTFHAAEEASRKAIGQQLFTLLFVDGDEVARIYSSDPEAYPVSGRKKMGPTPWGDHVLRDKKPLLLPDRAGIKWAFFDHELIYSLGLGSCINIPSIYNGKVIGTINLLAPEGVLTNEDLEIANQLGPVLVPAFLAARFENNAR
ncbi:hypothetical protein MesoLjLc_04420 [Mesorhizobium sp. L-8-10]|uniref:GAF domain-containing protein n=1 Tax=unclassified Mesorhizobium TaxID=325217 RepID=UPI001927EE1A|nr:MULTISPECIES: GAF domain-containing protein [unclassified Mesorhizobium]BCH20668.1 hypothetical protein MesoLjLb_04530 [Mesorhizobium sp. L-8-3]BCH28512.1 hypothetical protein MesoLjLc_04420 [Mesorhizobium sp. L-8-10]